MRYPDDKNSKEEEDHWIGLSDFERERFERHADFLIDRGYTAVDPLTLSVRIAWKTVAARGSRWIRTAIPDTFGAFRLYNSEL
jgi:hypothetical protein